MKFISSQTQKRTQEIKWLRATAGYDMDGVQTIRNYILFLKGNCRLDISLHPMADDNVITPTDLISFKIHDNPYCTYLKSCNKARQHCVCKQQQVFEQSKCGSFCGVCHAGVKEYVYPIKDGHNTLGFLSVSGYQTEKSAEYFDRISEKYELSRELLEKNYYALKPDMPPKAYVDTLIEPICRMLELAYLKAKSSPASEPNFNQQLLQYLRLHHTEDITYQDICAQFPYSRSYISHHFKQENGLSLREYLNMLRMEDAKALLVYSELTITEISVAVGFNESSYFSRVFKEYYGMSPQKYRSTAAPTP